MSAIGRWFRRVTNRVAPSDELFYRAEKRLQALENKRLLELRSQLPAAIAFVEERLLSGIDHGRTWDMFSMFSTTSSPDWPISCTYRLCDFLDVGLKTELESKGYNVNVLYWGHRRDHTGVRSIEVTVG